MTQHNRSYRIMTFVALAFLTLTPLQAKATSHSLVQLRAKVDCGAPYACPMKIDGYAGWSLALKDPFTVGAGLAPNAAIFLIGAVPGGPPGRHTLWVKVDSENAQAELNEYNNEATATTTCN
ncbi:MAG: hypothetical protein HYY12_06540 [Candidatus Methylomirabilis oxyfera]|nr:hypothetical protein [Candidatus Methylomirabilis oxyfera]